LYGHWRIIFRWTVILGALFGASAVGLATVRFEGSELLQSVLWAIPIALPGVLIWYLLGQPGRGRSNWFQYGILLILLTAGIIRFELKVSDGSYVVTSLMITVVVIGVWFLQMLLHDKKIYIKPSPINKPVITFMVISFMALVWSNLFRDPLIVSRAGSSSFLIVQLASLIVMILLPGLILLMVNKITEVKWLKWLTSIMIGLGIGAILSIELNLPLLEAFHTRGLFITWVGGLSYALILFNKELSIWIRGLLLLVLFAWLRWALIDAGSWISGWLPLIVACGWITWLYSKKYLLLLLLPLAVLFIWLNSDFWNTIFAAESAGSGAERYKIWQINLGHVYNHPFFGMGPAGYAVYNMTYNPEDARSTHNNLFDILAQTGLIGSAAFAWLFFVLLRIGSKTSRMLAGRRNFAEAFANATYAGCLAALVAMTLGDWVIPFAYNQTIAGFDDASYTWIFLGGMVSLYHIVKAKERPDHTQNDFNTT